MDETIVMGEAGLRLVSRGGARRRREARLGDLVADLVFGEGLPTMGRLRQIAEAWLSVVPAEYARRSKVESLYRGRLTVIVDSAAAKYVLGRQLGRALVRLVNNRLGEAMVKVIEYRVGSWGEEHSDRRLGVVGRTARQ